MSDTIQHAWRVFGAQSDSTKFVDRGPQTTRSSFYTNNASWYRGGDIIGNVISRIALDASMAEFKHMKINEESGNQTPMNSKLQRCLTFEANIDQSGRAFIYDAVWSLLDEGVIALVPTKTSRKPAGEQGFDVEELRVGKIVEWAPQDVRVRIYNENNGQFEEVWYGKRTVAIMESPFYTLLKDNNPTLKLLQQKVLLMNSVDKNAAAGKLNGFLQFPYQTRSESRQLQAARRRKEIEEEMTNSAYGLATLDANEKFVPAGGGLENNLLEDIRRLTQDFYNSIGITEKILDGTATPSEINAYYYKTIDPVLQAITDALNRAFLTKTAYTQGQRIMYYRDPFRTLPVETLSTTADVFSRNAILTPNEIRKLIGKPPHPDQNADQLFNRNIADQNQFGGAESPGQMDPMGGDQGMQPPEPMPGEEPIDPNGGM